MTPEEAKLKYCPLIHNNALRNYAAADGSFSTNSLREEARHCLGQDCMMWRDGKKPEDGYCGLAGPL